MANVEEEVLQDSKDVKEKKEDCRLEEDLVEMCIRESLAEEESDTASSTPPKISVAEHKAVDIHQAQPKPMARFVKDVTMPDGSEIAPCSTFFKTWRVRNDGPCDWPEGSHLVSAGGDSMINPKLIDKTEVRQTVPAVAKGEEVDITLELCAPNASGRYISYFRLETPEGNYFGQRLWADIRVSEMDMSMSMSLLPWEVVEQATKSNTSEENSLNVEGVDNEVTSANNSVSSIHLTASNSQTEEDHELAVWSHELGVLAAMGFHDTQKVLPVLKSHVKVPANLRTGGEKVPASEEGLQAAVLALLSNQE